ncbi:MAG TPA: Fe-S cluster assembly protein SufD [Ilumatobacteraceae bacterium]|nr:Fe-S cluster assembly protein SufD [Ilumatobacteraceae bacterium]
MSPTAAASGELEVLDGIGFPTKRDEAWRYAPHRRLGQLTFGPNADGLVGESVELGQRIPDVGGPRIVVVNGVVSPELSTFDAEGGLHLSTLADAADSGAATVRGHRDGATIVDAYAALNVAYATDGAVIRIDDGAQIEAPIHVVDVAVPGSLTNTSTSAVVIRLGAGSSATIVETRIGIGTSFGGSNVHTSIVLGDDAALEHILIQDLPAQQVHLSRVEITQGERCTMRTRSFNLGGSYGRLAYTVELTGADAIADLSGLFFGAGEQILDQQITVVHSAKDCTSRQSFRGLLDDASSGVFNGGIDVCPGADGTDAEQSNDNLLLSNRAEVNTQPRLEILADEVACKHGATVGQLDDTALYYLRSRGINAEDARRLLINGFADQIVDDVSVDAVRTWITRRLGHDHD